MEAMGEAPAADVLLCKSNLVRLSIKNIPKSQARITSFNSSLACEANGGLKSQVQSSNGPRMALGRYSHRSSDAYLSNVLGKM